MSETVGHQHVEHVGIGEAHALVAAHLALLQLILHHCYSGSKELVKEYEKYDFYYSFGGAVTFKNAVDKPDVVRSVPIDRLLLETDCPYMTPVPYRGTPNEPKHINLVADKIAEILQKDRKEVEEITLQNTERFFKRLGSTI